MEQSVVCCAYHWTRSDDIWTVVFSNSHEHHTASLWRLAILMTLINVITYLLIYLWSLQSSAVASAWPQTFTYYVHGFASRLLYAITANGDHMLHCSSTYLLPFHNIWVMTTVCRIRANRFRFGFISMAARRLKITELFRAVLCNIVVHNHMHTVIWAVLADVGLSFFVFLIGSVYLC